MDVYENPMDGDTPEAEGLSVDLQALYDDCKAELDEFKLDAEAEMMTQIDAYKADAGKQEHKAKADFLRLIEASIIKLHGIKTLTGEEKVMLKDAIVDKRMQFGTDVGTWATELGTAMDNLLSQAEDEDAGEVAGLTEDNDAKIAAFEADMETDTVDGGDSADSIIEQLRLYNEERRAEVEDQITKEDAIGDALASEIQTWLTGHIDDLQAALAEICEQEHAYHYHPPGYHVDETAIELEAFQKLSEKFALVVIQMTGTFDSWTAQIMEKITDLKE